MTVLAHRLAPAEPPEHEPRLLTPVPTAPPYDDEDDLLFADLPLALVLPGRFGGPAVDLPALAQVTTGSAGSAAPDSDERVVEAELRRLFGSRRTPRDELPAPAPRAAAAVRLLLEVIAGERPVRQVAGWVSPRVLAGLDGRSARQRLALGRRPVLRSVRVTEPADGVAEISAVVALGDRARAVALRLEGLDGRWTVTALHVG